MMSCFLLPSTPFLKLAFMPRLVTIGYQNYPAQPATALAAPTITPSAAVASPTQFQQQALTTCISQTVTNGTFRPTLLPGVACAPNQGSAVQAPPRPEFNALGNRNSVFNRHHFKSGFHTHRGLKRKNEDSDSNANPDSTVSEFMQPLHCKICRVTLNAPAQAKQHYEGKNHSRKLKMFMEGKAESEKDGKEQPSSTTNGTSSPKKPIPEINPEVYCKVCGVSFNSPKQAHQHYNGKNHAKKMRASRSESATGGSPASCDVSSSNKHGSKFVCLACKLQVSSQEQLESHIHSTKHYVKSKAVEKANAVLTGRWQLQKPSNSYFHSGLPMGIHALSQNASAASLNFHQYAFHTNNNNNNNNNNKRLKQDFSMHRTPSGKFYCSACNLTFSSDSQFGQHLDSKKHKACLAVRKHSNSESELS